MIEIRRVYGEKGRSDGFRILVDRLWPRGLKKEQVRPDLWLKDVAPSTGLRKWFRHDPERWREFKRRYFEELKEKEEELEQIREHEQRGRVILLYGARDPEINHAAALKEYLESKRTK